MIAELDCEAYTESTVALTEWMHFDGSITFRTVSGCKSRCLIFRYFTMFHTMTSVGRKGLQWDEIILKPLHASISCPIFLNAHRRDLNTLQGFSNFARKNNFQRLSSETGYFFWKWIRSRVNGGPLDGGVVRGPLLQSLLPSLICASSQWKAIRMIDFFIN